MINKNILKTSEYGFLQKNSHLGSNIILLGLGGSHAYGTNIPTSDIDIRGVALNSKEEILLGRDFENVVDNATDTTVYSFNKIIELLSNCNPNTIEMLGLAPEDYLRVSPIGQWLIDNADLFLSKQAANSFGGYANQQLYRLQQKSLVALSEEEYNAHTARVLTSMVQGFEKKFGITSDCIKAYTDSDGKIRLDIAMVSVPAEQLSAILGELNNTIREYNKNSSRNNKAETHGKIAKHSMHLLRLYMMCIDILENHIVVTKRTEEHDLLMDVRNGKFLGSDGKPNADFFDLVKEYEEKFNRAKATTTLPDKPNTERINEFKIEVNKMIVKNSVPDV